MRKENVERFETACPGRALGPDVARPTEAEIAALARELWKARGCPQGSPRAERVPEKHS
jgi:hypothetical protein